LNKYIAEIMTTHAKATLRRVATMVSEGASDEQIATQRRAVEMAQAQRNHYVKTGDIVSGFVLLVSAKPQENE
jgi:hypothetical protein